MFPPLIQGVDIDDRVSPTYDRRMVVWKEILSTEIEKLRELKSVLNVNPLALEDCLHRDQRPKLEDYQNHQFLVWFLLFQGEVYEIQFLIFPDQLIVVPHDPPKSSESWESFLHIYAQHKQKDVWHLLYYALDKLTDITWHEIRSLLKALDNSEGEIFIKDFSPQSLLSLKKHLNEIDYSIGHLPSVTKQLQNFCQPKDDLAWKLRDLHDHCERIYRALELYRSQISATIELFWGFQAHRTNRQIKKLSLLASIAVPLTFWASFWGMNFDIIPFSNSKLFIAALSIMILSVGVTMWLLIRKGYWSD